MQEVTNGRGSELANTTLALLKDARTASSQPKDWLTNEKKDGTIRYTQCPCAPLKDEKLLERQQLRKLPCGSEQARGLVDSAITESIGLFGR